MMTEDQVNDSPFMPSAPRESKAVKVEICEDGEGGWILAVVDKNGRSTVWASLFASDMEALNEALITIDEDAIDSPLEIRFTRTKANLRGVECSDN